MQDHQPGQPLAIGGAQRVAIAGEERRLDRWPADHLGPLRIPLIVLVHDPPDPAEVDRPVEPAFDAVLPQGFVLRLHILIL